MDFTVKTSDLKEAVKLLQVLGGIGEKVEQAKPDEPTKPAETKKPKKPAKAAAADGSLSSVDFATLKKKAVEVTKLVGKDPVKALLTNSGVDALSELPEDKRDEFYAALGKLVDVEDTDDDFL
jgi:hypothetical protein